MSDQRERFFTTSRKQPPEAACCGCPCVAERLSVVCEDGFRALDDVSFELPYGSRTALVGANGAGKSTLLLTMTGVVPLSAGVMRLADGTELTARASKQALAGAWRRIGLVFQNPDDQLFTASVAEDVAFGLRHQDVPPDDAEISRRVDAALEGLGIIGLRERSPARLSFGEKRRVALASVLVMEPELLLLDEPTSFLDPRARRMLCRTLDAVPQTLLIATHDLELAIELCDRTILLHRGRVRGCGPTANIFADRALLIECELDGE